MRVCVCKHVSTQARAGGRGREGAEGWPGGRHPVAQSCKHIMHLVLCALAVCGCKLLCVCVCVCVCVCECVCIWLQLCQGLPWLTHLCSPRRVSSPTPRRRTGESGAC